jgi:hypothetical protein
MIKVDIKVKHDKHFEIEGVYLTDTEKLRKTVNRGPYKSLLLDRGLHMSKLNHYKNH